MAVAEKKAHVVSVKTDPKTKRVLSVRIGDELGRVFTFALIDGRIVRTSVSVPTHYMEYGDTKNSKEVVAIAYAVLKSPQK